MAGKFSIYKYVKLENKGWRYARAAYHPNGKIKSDTRTNRRKTGAMRTTATPCGSEMTIEEAFLHDAFAQAAQHVSTRTSAPAQY
jgi:hypothetical protein